MSSILNRVFLLWLWLLSFAHLDQGLVLPPICEIRGAGFTSPWLGTPVRVRGVVFADQDQSSSSGFYIQQSDCDADSLTSDGIWIYLSQATDVVSQGEDVEVSGVVEEYYGMTEIQAALGNISRRASRCSTSMPIIRTAIRRYRAR